MGKNKSQEIDLLYVSEEKKKKVGGKNKKSPPKKRAKKDKQKSENDDIFKFDEEIVIGLPNKKINNEKKKQSKIKNKKNITSKAEQTKTKETKKKSKIGQIAKWFILLMLLVGSIIFFLMSPLFNIKQIEVVQNLKITDEEIISLSEIKENDNIFKVMDWQVKDKIKQNAYIDEVTIKRILPNKIQIKVTERTTTFMLECVNSYAYINNQGYILEINQEKQNVPIITGTKTTLDEMKPGSRLQKEDLYKLETLIKILETANIYEIGNKITKFNIQDKNNYEMFLEEEKKTVYLGDASNINTRILYLKEIIEKEKGKELLVFLNVDLNTQNVYTREKV